MTCSVCKREICGIVCRNENDNAICLACYIKLGLNCDPIADKKTKEIQKELLKVIDSETNIKKYFNKLRK